MPSIGSTPVSVGRSSQLVQNLGPDNLYVGVSDSSGVTTLTVETGFRVSVGESISLNASSSWNNFVVSEGTSEIRTLTVGVGVFSAVASQD